MTGMKEGAGEDPFAEDEPVDQDPADDIERREGPAETADATEPAGDQRSGQHQAVQIPYKFRRDGVQDGRDRVPLFLQSDTKRAERKARRELEDRFNDDLSLTDLREALVKTGLDNLDEVEGQLEEWGYGITFND